MGKKKQLELEEGQREGGESKVEKKRAREEKAKERKKIKKQDKIERWSGMILFVILLVLGFLMWVSGEVQNPTNRGERVTPQRAVPAQELPGGSSRVIVE